MRSLNLLFNQRIVFKDLKGVTDTKLEITSSEYWLLHHLEVIGLWRRYWFIISRAFADNERKRKTTIVDFESVGHPSSDVNLLLSEFSRNCWKEKVGKVKRKTVTKRKKWGKRKRRQFTGWALTITTTITTNSSTFQLWTHYKAGEIISLFFLNLQRAWGGSHAHRDEKIRLILQHNFIKCTSETLEMHVSLSTTYSCTLHCLPYKLVLRLGKCIQQAKRLGIDLLFITSFPK